MTDAGGPQVKIRANDRKNKMEIPVGSAFSKSQRVWGFTVFITRIANPRAPSWARLG
ncbi:MAG: hypothetical protein ABUL66_03625 [Verrucomicrobiota bacterium]